MSWQPENSDDILYDSLNVSSAISELALESAPGSSREKTVVSLDSTNVKTKVLPKKPKKNFLEKLHTPILEVPLSESFPIPVPDPRFPVKKEEISDLLRIDGVRRVIWL